MTDSTAEDVTREGRRGVEGIIERDEETADTIVSPPQQPQQHQQQHVEQQFEVDDDDDIPMLVSLESTTASLLAASATTIEAAEAAVPSNPNHTTTSTCGTTDSFTATQTSQAITTTSSHPQQQQLLPQQPQQQQQPQPCCCPVTILSGFLGSGKTTLIQHLLQSSDHGKRIAVIENEFGDGNLMEENNNNNDTTTTKDGLQRSIESLIAQNVSKTNNNNTSSSSTLSDWIELPNGCICCTVKDKLVTTLEHLITIKGDELDCILIEMSGMALPGPLASLFWLDDDDGVLQEPALGVDNASSGSSPSPIHNRLRLDGIVTVVDAYHIESQLQTTHEAACQIAQADRILLNKMDLLLQQPKSSSTTTAPFDSGSGPDLQQQQRLLAMIHQLNPTALIQTTSYGQVNDWKWIFDIHSLEMDQRTIQQHVGDLNLNAVSDTTTTSAKSIGKDDEQDVPPDACYICNDSDCGCEHDGDHHHHVHDHESAQHDDHNTDQHHQQPLQQQQHFHTSGVSTITLSIRGSVDFTKINMWVASILWPQQDEADKVLRARLDMQTQQPQNAERIQPQKDLSSKREQHNDTTTTTRTPTTKFHENNTQKYHQQQIFRIKGILSVRRRRQFSKAERDAGDDNDDDKWIDPQTGLDRRYYIVQAVHDLWEIHPSLNGQFLWKNDTTRTTKQDDRICKLIVIGRYLNAASLRASFEACAVELT